MDITRTEIIREMMILARAHPSETKTLMKLMQNLFKEQQEALQVICDKITKNSINM